MQRIIDSVQANNVSYLHNVSEILAKDIPSVTTLKSYLTTKSCLAEVRSKISLPNKLKNSRIKCPKCNIARRYTECLPVIKPENKLDRYRRRLIKKQSDVSVLTRYQKKSLKSLQNIHSNQLLFSCKICKNKFRDILKKPEKVKRKTKDFTETMMLKKKKKKKDKLSGLNPEAVASAMQRNIENVKKQENVKGSVDVKAMNKKKKKEIKLLRVNPKIADVAKKKKLDDIKKLGNVKNKAEKQTELVTIKKKKKNKKKDLNSKDVAFAIQTELENVKKIKEQEQREACKKTVANKQKRKLNMLLQNDGVPKKKSMLTEFLKSL